MARIKTIEIKNIKGIKQKTLTLDLIPNKPSILVASNGFGKTSFATAFNSLNRKRIDLAEKDRHELNEANKPEIQIGYSEDNRNVVTYTATDTSNDIFNEFDIQVIRSNLESKHTKRNMGAFTHVSSCICVPPIVLIDKIPQKQNLNYSYTHFKNSFGQNGKILPNISTEISNPSIISKIYSQVDMGKLLLAKPTAAINSFKMTANKLNGSASSMISTLNNQHINLLSSIPALDKIADILNTNGVTYDTKIEYYLAALQFSDLYNTDKNAFKKHHEYCSYVLRENRIKILFEILNSTWKDIKPTKENKQLVLNFPEAIHISNGERDILCFIAQLLTADSKLCKNKCILIIDEIFDYLDDANLISAQYYLSKMIMEYKSSDRQIYPIILTHLNPYYFKGYRFNDQKIYFLEKTPTSFDKKVYNLILKREEPSLKAATDTYYLHYHPSDTNLTSAFSALGLDASISTAATFKQYVLSQLSEYISMKNYDPVSVCCALRIKIEEIVYNALNPDHHASFLDKHGTIPKLEFAESCGAIIHEPFYLLGIIYNEAMHFSSTSQDYITPLLSRLNNRTIRKMINEVCSTTIRTIHK